MRLIGLMRLIRLIIYALTAQSYTKVFISERKITHIKKKRAFFFVAPTFFRKFAGAKKISTENVLTIGAAPCAALCPCPLESELSRPRPKHITPSCRGLQSPKRKMQ